MIKKAMVLALLPMAALAKDTKKATDKTRSDFVLNLQVGGTSAKGKLEGAYETFAPLARNTFTKNKTHISNSICAGFDMGYEWVNKSDFWSLTMGLLFDDAKIKMRHDVAIPPIPVNVQANTSIKRSYTALLTGKYGYVMKGGWKPYLSLSVLRTRFNEKYEDDTFKASHAHTRWGIAPGVGVSKDIAEDTSVGLSYSYHHYGNFSTKEFKIDATGSQKYKLKVTPSYHNVLLNYSIKM